MGYVKEMEAKNEVLNLKCYDPLTSKTSKLTVLSEGMPLVG